MMLKELAKRAHQAGDHDEGHRPHAAAERAGHAAD
jgi:hypothetical protein